MRCEPWIAALLIAAAVVPATARAQDDEEAGFDDEETVLVEDEILEIAPAGEEEIVAEPAFESPHFRFGVGLSTEVVLGSTLGALASLHIALGIRATESLSFLLRVSAPDAGAWARNGTVDALAGAAVTLGVEHLGLNTMGNGRGVAFDLGVGVWFIDERLVTGGLGTLPYASLRVLFLLEHPESEVLPLFSPTMGITAGAGIDPDTGVFLMRLGLVILGVELSAGG